MYDIDALVGRTSSKEIAVAPRYWQKALSYTSGWLSTLAWQAFVAVDSYICASIIQALITLNNPDYIPARWQTTLLMIAVLCGMGAFNIFLARWLAMIEGFFAVLHFITWIAVTGVLWAMTSVKQPARTVFTDFTGKSFLRRHLCNSAEHCIR